MKLVTRHALATMGAASVELIVISLLVPLLPHLPVIKLGWVWATGIGLGAALLWIDVVTGKPFDDAGAGVLAILAAPFMFASACLFLDTIENLPLQMLNVGAPLRAVAFALVGIVGGVGGRMYCKKKGC